jgi:hypothetical protein
MELAGIEPPTSWGAIADSGTRAIECLKAMHGKWAVAPFRHRRSEPLPLLYPDRDDGDGEERYRD